MKPRMYHMLLISQVAINVGSYTLDKGFRICYRVYGPHAEGIPLSDVHQSDHELNLIDCSFLVTHS